LGVLRLTSRFSSKDGRFSRKNRSRLAKQVSRMIPSRRDLRVSGDATLVGTGGTVRALARLDQVASGYRLNKIHGYALENESVQQLSRKFTRLTLDELGEIDAIGVDRAKTIVAGALVVRVLMRRLGFGRMVVSTHGLRDGIMEEFLHRSAHPRTGASRMRELEHLMRLQKPAPPSRIGIEVIEELTRAGVFDRRQMAILMEGIERVQTREYVESNPDALFGMVMSEDLAMSHEDQLLLAISLVRARRPRTANWLAMEHGPMIRRDDLKSVRKMGTCIRLLEILVRTTAQLRVTYSGGLQIRVIGDVSKFPSRLARISAESLSSAIKRPVKIVVSPEERSTRLEPLKVK
jgi:exopolyphosphatase/guanosine-5'-triphosphate,3'-diphosphate pyrophosphatase